MRFDDGNGEQGGIQPIRSEVSPGVIQMQRFTKLIAIAVMGLGLAIIAMGAVNWQKANAGLESLDAVYRAQNVNLTYNEDGQLIDRGETEGAEAIMALLQDDWKFPVVEADLDPADPLANTPTELMYQYAAINYHTLNGTQTVVLDEGVEYDGEFFEAGTYEVPVDGRYWTDFDRQHPLEGVVRESAWNGTVHGLLGEIGAGVAADYQAGFAHFAAWRTMIVGLAFVLGGVGLFALASRESEKILFAAAETREEALAS
jgi:hypothetical protein